MQFLINKLAIFKLSAVCVLVSFSYLSSKQYYFKYYNFIFTVVTVLFSLVSILETLNTFIGKVG